MIARRKQTILEVFQISINVLEHNIQWKCHQLDEHHDCYRKFMFEIIDFLSKWKFILPPDFNTRFCDEKRTKSNIWIHLHDNERFHTQLQKYTDRISSVFFVCWKFKIRFFPRFWQKKCKHILNNLCSLPIMPFSELSHVIISVFSWNPF